MHIIKYIYVACLAAISCYGVEFEDIPDNYIVAATLILEAGGEEAPNAMVAVYEVISNRAVNKSRSKRDIVLQRKQFSCWNNVKKRKSLYMRAISHPKFTKALAIVQNPTATSYTSGADHYHADYVSPYWISSLERTVTIGRHVFYRQSTQ